MTRPRGIFCLWIVCLGILLLSQSCVGEINIQQEIKACGIHLEVLKKGVRSANIPPEHCPLVRKFFLWKTLQKSTYSYPLKQFYDFVKTHKNWPKLRAIQERGEQIALGTSEDMEVLKWFELIPPISGEGAAHYIKVLQKQKQFKKASELIPLYWQEKAFNSPNTEIEFLKKHRSHITQKDNQKRMMLFGMSSKEDMLKRMIRYVSQDYQKMIGAVIAMIKESRGVQRALNQIPKRLRDHPLVVFHRIQWYIKKDKILEAIILMEYAINQQMIQNYPEKWIPLRLRLARESCQKKLYKVAYTLVKDVGTIDSRETTEAQFLAGWIAFRKLNKLDQAFKHFKAFYDMVKTPISQSKGAYWCGRVLDAKNEHDLALRWYQVSAENGGTFYGQEARKILGHEKQSLLKPFSRGRWEEIDQPETVEHFALLHLLDAYKYDQDKLTFLNHLSTMVNTPSAQEAFLRITQKIAPRHLVLMSKVAGKNGTLLFYEAYPRRAHLFKNRNYHENLTSALFHSIIRQESGFDEQAVSPAGAKGLMQLRPAVAKEIAKKMKIRYCENDLVEKPHINTIIGSEFLSRLLHKFEGDLVLAIASYNAGEGRIQKWLKTYGDPRDKNVDTLDWIEMIPFEETRSYIHRVLESIPLYEPILS